MKHFSLSTAGAWITALCLALMLSTPSFAQEIVSNSPVLSKIVSNHTLRVGVNPQFKPFSFKQSGKRVGVDIDIAGLLARKLGVNVDIITPKSFSDLIPMLLADKIDIIIAGMSITFDRAKVVDFSNSYFDTGLSILLNKVTTTRLGISAAPSYAVLHDELLRNGKANQLVVAVTEGKAPQRVVPRFFPQAQIKAYPSNEAAAEATLKGEADIMVHDEIFLKVWLKENAKRASFRLAVLDPPFKPDFYGFAIHKGNQDFLNMLNVFALELQSNGHVVQFMGKYLPVKSRVVTRSYNISEDYYGGD